MDSVVNAVLVSLKDKESFKSQKLLYLNEYFKNIENAIPNFIYLGDYGKMYLELDSMCLLTQVKYERDAGNERMVSHHELDSNNPFRFVCK